ncbi:MAG TPA: DUF6364 family protein [Puia sp.]|jgi:uncharacterized protein YaiL (DUF2058 family)
MKERLNLTIDADLVESMKAYAASKQMSVSELVESYFKAVTKTIERKNIVDLVDGLVGPAAEMRDGVWMDAGYEEAKKRHGI